MQFFKTRTVLGFFLLAPLSFAMVFKKGEESLRKSKIKIRVIKGSYFEAL